MKSACVGVLSIIAAYKFCISRMLWTPITEQARQQEWNVISTIARNNGFPLQIIHNLKKNLLLKTQKIESTLTQTQRKKWITFTYHRPLIHEVTSLFKSTDLNIAIRTCDNIYNQLCDRIPLNKINSSGIYKLQCKSRNKSYVGQTGSAIEIRHREHTRYIQTNNPISACALNILNNRHEYENPEKKLCNY
jgi:hypothetical protein